MKFPHTGHWKYVLAVCWPVQTILNWPYGQDSYLQVFKMFCCVMYFCFIVNHMNSPILLGLGDSRTCVPLAMTATKQLLKVLRKHAE